MLYLTISSMSCLRGAPCCSNDTPSLYIPARRSADGWLRSKFFKTSSREKVFLSLMYDIFINRTCS